MGKRTELDTKGITQGRKPDPDRTELDTKGITQGRKPDPDRTT